MDCKCGLRGRVPALWTPALQKWSSEFKTQSHQKKSIRTQNQYTNTTSFSVHQQWTDWERNWKSNSIHDILKKYLVTNLIKEVKDLYNENFKSLERRHQKMERSLILIDCQNQYYENSYTSKSNLYIQCNPIKIPMIFFTFCENTKDIE
jgi:hypothetical protein